MAPFVPAPPRVSPGPSKSSPVPPLAVPVCSEAWFGSPSEHFATRSCRQGRVMVPLLPSAQMPVQPPSRDAEEMGAERDSAAEVNGEEEESEEERSGSQTESEEESSGEPHTPSSTPPAPPSRS